MPPDNVDVLARPRLSELLLDARQLSRRQVATELLRPWPPLLAFIVFASLQWWIAAGVAVVFVFAADVVVVHDLFHRNLGLPNRTNSTLTGIYGLLLLNSGHALARTHLQHHRVYPNGDDPEAYVDGWPVWRVALEGPLYRFRVWRWAWRHRSNDAPTLAAEMAFWLTGWVAALAVGDTVPALRAYVLFAELGSWFFPLISVTGVHDRHAPGVLQQSRTLRAPLLGRLMLGMQYHLEHHLYPRVPAARLADLADALTPWLEQNGAAIWATRAPSTTSTRRATPTLTRGTRAVSNAAPTSV